jgi:hypothetical protein
MGMDLSTGGFHYGSIGAGFQTSQHLSEAMPIVQVGHQISDDTVTHISSEKQELELTEDKNIQPIKVSEMKPRVPVSETKTMTSKEILLSQGLTSVSERYDSFHPLVVLSCFFTVAVLLVFSFRLLRNDETIS